MLQVTDLAGKVTFEVWDAKAVEARKKALNEAYEKAVKAAEADASAPKPSKPVVAVLKDGIADKAKAEAEAARCKEEYEKKQKEASAAKAPPQ